MNIFEKNSSFMSQNIDADFCIEIDYKKNSENPSRVFKAMSSIIESIQQIDIDLIGTIDNTIQPVLLLEDIESCCIRAWLKNVLTKVVDDDALKSLDWKKQVGKYLVKAKYLLIDFLDNKTQITDKQELLNLQNNILQLAESTDVKNFPDYTPLSQSKLIHCLDLINKSTSNLESEDKVKFIHDENSTPFNLEFNFSPEVIAELLTKETITSTQTMILKVKKPDYLGTSKWEFKHDRNIFCKILHEDWLKDFQSRRIDIRPGDSIRAEVKVIVNYGFDNDIVSTEHEIIKVEKVIECDDNDNQHKIDFTS